MRLNTVDEQCALIRAEAEGKWIEYETFDGIWCGKLTEKGGWSFNTLCYRVKPEPAAPVVEEYPIEMSGGEYFYIKDGQRCRIHLAAQRGFVFVHEDGNYYGQAIMWRGKDGMLFADGGPNCKPAIAKAVRRVLK